jgi:hypothetical protein
MPLRRPFDVDRAMTVWEDAHWVMSDLERTKFRSDRRLTAVLRRPQPAVEAVLRKHTTLRRAAEELDRTHPLPENKPYVAPPPTVMMFTVYRPTPEIPEEDPELAIKSGRVTFSPVCAGGGYVYDNMFWDKHLIEPTRPIRPEVRPSEGDLVVLVPAGQRPWCGIYNNFGPPLRIDIEIHDIAVRWDW